MYIVQCLRLINLSGFFVIPTDFQSWSFKRTLGTDATVSLYCSHVFGWSILFHDDKSKEPDLHKKSSVTINQYSFTTFDKTLNIWQTPIKLMLQICVVTMIGVTQNQDLHFRQLYFFYCVKVLRT